MLGVVQRALGLALEYVRVLSSLSAAELIVGATTAAIGLMVLQALRVLLFPSKPVVLEYQPAQVGDVTLEELSKYCGADPFRPILFAVRGRVFDVTAGRDFYGPGGWVGGWLPGRAAGGGGMLRRRRFRSMAGQRVSEVKGGAPPRVGRADVTPHLPLPAPQAAGTACLRGARSRGPWGSWPSRRTSAAARSATLASGRPRCWRTGSRSSRPSTPSWGG